jgi:glutathione peroxidase
MKKLLSLCTIVFSTLSTQAYQIPQKSLLEFTVKDIDGNDYNLNNLAGKTILVVNVASKCGLTKQYTDLQKLYEKYKDKGFVILGFPANNFFGQEPGSNKDIKLFCSTKYNVTFPMMSKISVKGNDMADVYKFLTSHPEFGGKIKWNFDKFLVNGKGKIIERFGPRTKPMDKKLIQAIEAQIK